MVSWRQPADETDGRQKPLLLACHEYQVITEVVTKSQHGYTHIETKKVVEIALIQGL